MIIWLASYPRSGNTLIRLLVSQALGLRTYSQYNDRNDLGADPDVAATVGHVSYEGKWSAFYKQARAGDDLHLVKTHDYPRDEEKAIYVLRDGRSSIVSYRHYIESFGGQAVSLAQTILGAVPFGGWSDHVKAWRPLQRPNTLFLKYEDIVANREGAIAEIARFLGLEVAGSAVSQFDELHAKEPNFFRSGSNTRNIEEFDESHLALFRMFHGKTMASYGYDRGADDLIQADVLLPAIETMRAGLLEMSGYHNIIRQKEELTGNLRNSNKLLADATAVAEHLRKERAEKDNTHAAKLREKDK
ncbi:sulfotransferase domain-containing protein, partial [Allomesorhizobium camelthorni]